MVEHKKRIIHNFISLSFVQGLSIVFPLFTFPYLVRVLGIESFGVFTLIQTLMVYFDLLISFGFGLTATKYITQHINNPEKTGQVITGVYLIKLFLLLVTMVLFLAASIFIPYLKQHFFLVLTSFVFVLGNLLFPDWYFQGIQKMRNIAVVTFISKFISLALLIVLVKSANDIGYAILSISAGNFIAGLIGLLILVKKTNWKIIIPPFSYLSALFKESAYVFSSMILAPLYSSINLFILQVFTTPLIVGYYAVAEKIFSAISMLTSIINRTFYPHLTQLYTGSKLAYKRNVRQIIILFFCAFATLAVMQFFFAEFIVKLLSGKKLAGDISYTVEILRIMSVGLLFSPFIPFFFQLLIIQGQKKESIRNIFIAVVVNLITASFFAYFYSGTGMAINLSMIIILLAILNYFSYHKKLQTL